MSYTPYTAQHSYESQIAGANIAGANIAQNHHRGVALGPAFADIGARRLLADGGQAEAAHERLGFPINRRGGRLDPDPGRLARARTVRIVALFRVAEGFSGGQFLSQENRYLASLARRT